MKQINIGNWWGMLVTLFGRVGFYANMVSLVLVAFFAYPSVSTFINSWLNIVIPFWMFLVVVILLPFIGMIFEYVVGFPSFMAFNNQQAYKHSNPFRDDMEIIKKSIKEVNEKLDKIIVK